MLWRLVGKLPKALPVGEGGVRTVIAPAATSAAAAAADVGEGSGAVVLVGTVAWPAAADAAGLMGSFGERCRPGFELSACETPGFLRD